MFLWLIRSQGNGDRRPIGKAHRMAGMYETGIVGYGSILDIGIPGSREYSHCNEEAVLPLRGTLASQCKEYSCTRSFKDELGPPSAE